MTDPGAAAGGGYLHMLPMYLPEGMTVTAMSAAMLPWGSPAYLGALGTTPEGDPVLAATLEWPVNWLRTTDPVPKFDREWLQLRRYNADQALAVGAHAFASILPGDDPPDAVVTTDGGSIGVEATSLTIEPRRAVHGLFVDLRARLVAQDPVIFAKLRGHVIYVWFTDPLDDGLARPFRRSDDEAIGGLVTELASYEPQSQQMWVPTGLMPEQAPALPIGETDGGAKFYAIPIVAAAPSSMLFTIAGFEIGLAFTTTLTAQSAWSEIQRLVDDHDQPGVDLLLITAGGPDQRGNVFPVEEALFQFLITNPIGLTRTPDYIQRVVLHSWGTGSAHQIHPTMVHAFGPLYQSMVPLHHPLRVGDA